VLRGSVPRRDRVAPYFDGPPIGYTHRLHIWTGEWSWIRTPPVRMDRGVVRSRVFQFTTPSNTQPGIANGWGVFHSRDYDTRRSHRKSHTRTFIRQEEHAPLYDTWYVTPIKPPMKLITLSGLMTHGLSIFDISYALCSIPLTQYHNTTYAVPNTLLIPQGLTKLRKELVP
jgi:hypothetical protein